MRAEQAWAVLILLSFFLNPATAKLNYSLSFICDTSSLFYRSITIKNMMDEAVSTNSSLMLDISTSQFINFGFLKCGVYSLATISKISQAIYIFHGASLKNTEKMINRNCPSDQDTDSFDIVINSKDQSNISISFSVVSADFEPKDKPSRYLQSMYPKTVHLNVPAFSSVSYPIQLAALIKKALKTKRSVLRVSSDSGVPVKYMMQRCGFEVPGLAIYNRMDVKILFDLFAKSCDGEWLVDTVNIYIPNNEMREITEILHFEVVHGVEETNANATISLQPIIKSRMEQLVLPLHILISRKPYSKTIWPMLIFSIIASAVAVKFLVWLAIKVYNKWFRHDSYNVLERELSQTSSVHPESLNGSVQLHRQISVEELKY